MGSEWEGMGEEVGCWQVPYHHNPTHLTPHLTSPPLATPPQTPPFPQVWDPRDRSALAPPPAPSSKPSATQPKAGSKPTVTTTTATRTTTTTTNATATTTRATPSRLLTLQPTTLLSHCPSRVLFIVNTLVLPLNSHELAKLPDATSNEPVKPPGAFKRRRDLLARKPGHFIAVEYLEERPPLLQDDGMGARLVTFYQKRDAQVGINGGTSLGWGWGVGRSGVRGDVMRLGWLGWCCARYAKLLLAAITRNPPPCHTSPLPPLFPTPPGHPPQLPNSHPTLSLHSKPNIRIPHPPSSPRTRPTSP